MIEQILFLAAFFSIIWFSKLCLVWIVIPSYSNEKESVKKKYFEYQSKKGIANKFLKWLFVIFNSDILFPLKGSILASVFIILFILFKRVA